MAKLRRVAVLPSLFTLANGVFGFSSVIVASKIPPSILSEGGEGYNEALLLVCIAGWLIVGGMFCDVWDGFFARWTNAASRFGAELDSLCDAVTFGVAPAFLLLKLGPSKNAFVLYDVLFIASTFYVICTILRLARFNVESTPDLESHRSFKGLPSPAAAGCIATTAILRFQTDGWAEALHAPWLGKFIANLLPFGAMGLAVLMVSTIRYPHLVNQSLRGRRSFSHLVRILVVLIVIAFNIQLLLFVSFWGFALFGPVRYSWLWWRRPAAVVPSSGPQPTNDSLASKGLDSSDPAAAASNGPTFAPRTEFQAPREPHS